MARPGGDGKILKDNRSSYNLIAHDHHVPQSPLFGPSPRRPQDYHHSLGYQKQSGDDVEQNYPDSKGHADDGEPEMRDTWDRNHQVAWRQEADQPINKGYSSPYNMIKHERHIPASPLYRPGQGDGTARADPRYGSAQEGGRDYGGGRDYQVARPKDPPTPDYNTTQLHIAESNNDDDTKLQLGALKGSQEDLRDYRPNNVSWAGYQDPHVSRGPPNTDRPSHGGERSYRDNPWTSRTKAADGVADPRVGGQHDGIGLVGSRNGGALLFIRFPVGQGENIRVASQAFLKSKTHDNGGRFLGLAKKAHDFGYEKGPTEAIGVFHFPSIDKAFLFFQMDPIIRQPDFPPPYGHAEMWIVCNAYLPDNLQLFNTFLLSEVQLHSGKEKREFFDTFQKPFENYLYKNGAMPFVVCSYGAFDRKSLRRHNYPPTAIVTCHLFQGLDHLNWITSDETYSKFRSLHNQMATEKCSIFSLSKEL